MRFSDRFLDDIRDRLRISEVVGQRVQFDKKKTNAAKGDFWARCPFHEEKTPSFHCEDRKGRYYCFSCGASGDHFRFLTELDGLSFPEAVELLAGQAGLPMPVMDKREQEREAQRKSLFEVMELAAQFFENQLHEPVGANARAYLRGRGLSTAIQNEFRIGFSPNSKNALKEFLASKGVNSKQMEDCGLVVHGEGIALPYDRFRDRIMYPIEDSKGRVIAFGGRAMNPDAKAKYLNSPETELFKKSNVLYNFKRARKSIHTSSEVIVAEGYMDVIALHAAGFKNAVAPLGTALTGSHLDTLWTVCDKPTLCFDGDSAGQRAASRAVELALPKLSEGKTIKFLALPDGLDPDDFLKQFGSEKFIEIFNSSTPLHDMVLKRHLIGAILDTPEQKAKLEKDVMADIAMINDPAILKYYKSHHRMKLYELFGSTRKTKFEKSNSVFTEELINSINDSEILTKSLLGMCVEYPGILREFIEEIVEINFDGDGYNLFVGEIYKLYVEFEDLSVALIYDKIDPNLKLILDLVHGNEKRSSIMLKAGKEKKEFVTKRGHKLMQLFPILRYVEEPDILRWIVKLIIFKLQYKNITMELQTLKDEKTDDADFIYSLKLEIEQRALEIAKIEHELSEQIEVLKGLRISSGYIAA